MTVGVIAALKRRKLPPPPPTGYPGGEATKIDWKRVAQRRRWSSQKQEADAKPEPGEPKAHRSPDHLDDDQRYHGSGGFPFS
ncbi:hypothetical protein DKP78_24080, partial [Enterococcus faecium]